jgi:hypothetical protein
MRLFNVDGQARSPEDLAEGGLLGVQEFREAKGAYIVKSDLG